MAEQNTKICATCGANVPPQAIACPECGRGVFETQKSHPSHGSAAPTSKAPFKEEDIIAKCAEQFSDFAAHHASFDSADKAISFVKKLSFTYENDGEIAFPSNILIAVVRYHEGANLTIAGHLSESENYEVRKLAYKKGIEMKSMCVGSDSSLARREFLRAMFRVKEEMGDKDTIGKPWWKFW